MEKNIAKTIRQQEGRDKWKYARGRGTLWYEVGVGKTYTALLIIDALLRSKSDGIVIIVVPSVPIKEQWMKEIDSEIGNFRSKIKIYTSTDVITNHIHEECLLLIIDEIHEFAHDNKLEIVRGHYINYKYILGLTGTWENDDNSHHRIEPYCPVIDRIDNKEAIEKGFTAPIVEYNLGVEFTKQEREKYDYYISEIEKYKKIFDKDFILATKCIKGEQSKNYREQVARLNGWSELLNNGDLAHQKIINTYKPSKIFQYAVDFVSIVQQRIKLLYMARNKIQPVIELCRKFNVKTIVFSESTEFADMIYHDLNFHMKQSKDLLDSTPILDDICSLYHSNIKTIVRNVNGRNIKIGKVRLKRQAIEDITSGKTRIFVTSSVSDRGLNITDLRLGINVSANQNSNQQKQRKGRIVRVEFEKEVIVLFVNIYVKDTVEESWLKTKQKRSSNLVKTVATVEQIQHNFEK